MRLDLGREVDKQPWDAIISGSVDHGQIYRDPCGNRAAALGTPPPPRGRHKPLCCGHLQVDKSGADSSQLKGLSQEIKQAGCRRRQHSRHGSTSNGEAIALFVLVFQNPVCILQSEHSTIYSWNASQLERNTHNQDSDWQSY